MKTLPYLGLGLSTNAQLQDQPHPYALLDATPGLFDYVEYSAPLDVAQARLEASLWPQMEARRTQVPLVYHPVHLNLFGAELESQERLALAATHVTAMGSPWVSNDVGWWHHAGTALPGYLYLTPPLTSEGLALAVRHVKHVRDAMPVPVLIENPVVMTRRGTMHVLEFMSRLHEATGCPLLLDVGHLVAHQLTYGLPLDAGLLGVPWGQVAQLHVAGGVISQGGVYADDHPQPIRDEAWALFGELVKRAGSLRAVTYEADGHPDPVARRNLVRLRRDVPATRDTGFEVHAPAVATAEVEGAACWKLFAEVHATPGPERDFRLAVLAERLDAEVPLARAAVAPTLAQLAPFMAGPAFLEWFQRGTRPLGDSFLNWALGECRRPELAGADALVALEVWARTTWGRARKPGVAHLDTVFPADLTEAVHAAYALKRHVRGRELGEASAWEGLLQCARRAEKGPWAVRLSEEGPRVVVSPRI